MLAEFSQLELIQTFTIDQNGASSWVIESKEELHDGALARAGGADNCGGLVLLKRAVEALEDGVVSACWIEELYVFKFDLTFDFMLLTKLAILVN